MLLFIYMPDLKYNFLYLYLLRVAITKNANQKYTSNRMTIDEGYSRNASCTLNS